MYLSENYAYVIPVVGIVIGLIIVFAPDLIFSHYINKQEKYIEEKYKIVSIRNINMKVAFQCKGKNTIPSNVLYCPDDEDNKSKIITIESNEIYRNYTMGDIIIMQEVIYLTDEGIYLRDIKFASPREYQKSNECDEETKSNFIKVKDKNIKLLKKVSHSTINTLFSVTFFAVISIIALLICY